MNWDERTRFSEVVLPHLRDAFAYARWLAGNVEDAEDILQEASLRAYRGISGFRGENARGWVMKIVRNTAFTWLKARRDPMLVDMADDGGQLVATGAIEHATPESQLIERADAEQLEAGIDGLPPHFRETLVLREVHGYDYRAIAEITGVPIGTVMSRLARARRQLISSLRENDQ